MKIDGTKKARIVAKGFMENSFRTETYAPAARLSTVRIFTIALANDWQIRQLDVPTAFLNGRLTSEIYINAPEGVEH